MSVLRIVFICVLLITAACLPSQAQLSVAGGGPVSANALVNHLVGEGITFSNASYTGREIAVGTFNGTASNIGLNGGVIITTGSINVAPGPNNNGGATFSNNGPNIPELEALAQSTTLDGAILEFDFIPQSDEISFRYVFASEEYNEYVCSEFNDAFAFFITGPGITGTENLAMVPFTTTPITINTINNGTVGALGSITNSPCILGNSAYYVNNTQNSVQYDGFTTVLTASRTVIPCQTYHIRLMIADGADDIFDSAVFLEENSFTSSTYAVSISTFFNDSTIYEGCTQAEVVFSRPDADPDDLVINYLVGGSATPGVDYAALPGSITIPAGQTTASFFINAFDDALNEGSETVIITATTACGAIPQILFIRDKPPIDLVAPNAALCNGQGPVTLNAYASGGLPPYSYLWNTGATSSSISVNPVGVTPYTVTVTDFCGTVATANPMVIVADIPTASINAPPFVCSDVAVPVNYTGTASPAATYIWDFDGAVNINSGSAQGPYTVVWETDGLKTITLQVIENGCASNTVSTQVLVNPTPTSDFVVDPIVCAGQIAVVTYTGTGTDNGSYGWGFPGGVIITGGRRGPFEIRWDSVGVFGVTTTVTENGCTSPPFEVFVNVQPTPTGDFTPETPLCVGEASTIVYNGDASSTATYNWNFAGGTILSGSGAGPYEISWTNPGTKDVFLSVTENGCSGDIYTEPVVVYGIPTSSFSVASPVCAGQPTTVTYTGSANNNAQYDWDFGGATIIAGTGRGPYTIQWNNPGTYNVSLEVTRNGCTSPSFIQPVTVYSIPNPQFTVVSPVCVGQTSTIQSTGNHPQGSAFVWDFSGGQTVSGQGAGPYHVYWDNPGTKMINLIVSSPEGCPSLPNSIPVIVNPTPTSIFTAQTPICLNETSTITYNGSGNPSAQYDWNFNGGIPVSGGGQGPYEISWGTPGIKTITINVTENGCPSAPSIQQVNVLPLPSGFFTAASPVCVFGTSNIVYSGNAAPNAFFNWDFDNGVVVSGSGPGPYQVLWENPGQKSIRLTVVENGCASVQEVNVVQVTPIPTTNFTVESPLCLGENSTIVYTGNGLANATYNWDFGQAQVLSGSGNGPFEITYDSPGTYQVSLYLTQFGCSAPPSTRQIIVHPIPTANFIADQAVCIGSPALITYTGNGTAAGNYNWNFGGGIIQSGSGMGPYEVSWSTSGNHTVSLQLIENGCESEIATYVIESVPYPTSDFTTTPLSCEGQSSTITFTGQANTNATFDWDFGGGTIMSGNGAGPYQIVWNSTGESTISLGVEQQGCPSEPSETTLFVAPTPTANAGPDLLICPGDTVQIGIAETPGYEYQWLPPGGILNPTSGNPSLVLENWTNELVSHQYIVATTLGNCTALDTVVVVVQPRPQVDFQAPDGQCLNGNEFSFEVSGNVSTHASYNWVFGQFATPQNSTDINPSGIRFQTTGTHVITLTVTDWGCESPVYSDSIEIYAMPVANFSGTNLEGCPPLRVNLENLSADVAYQTFEWEMGNGDTIMGFDPEYSYINPGTFSITLTAITENGCRSSFTQHSGVFVYPVPQARFTVSPEVLTTEFTQAAITDQSIGAVSWIYDLGDGQMSQQRSLTHNYYEPGEYTIMQRVANEFGCMDTFQFRLKSESVMTFFIPNAFTPNFDGDNDIYRCYGLNIEQFRMEIYNRWGQMVFESNNIDYGWNGRIFNKEEQPISQMDVYAVVVYVKDNSDLPPRRIDHRVTLVR